jgi:hypothetical protein
VRLAGDVTGSGAAGTCSLGLARRRLLGLAGLAAVALGLMGHSPYRQWQVFRKSRLIIVVSATDGAAVELARSLAELLATHRPESRAMMSRAPDAVAVAKLLASQQLDLALMTGADARELLDGTGRVAEEGPVPLRALAAVGDYLIVCRDDFPAPRAREIAETLATRWTGAEPMRPPRSATAGGAGPAIPWHPAVLEYHESRASIR